jgi:hypothetical protein
MLIITLSEFSLAVPYQCSDMVWFRKAISKYVTLSHVVCEIVALELSP